MKNVNLLAPPIEHLNFSYAEFSHTGEVRDRDFTRAYFVETIVRQCRFVKCLLRNMDATRVTFIDCDFIDCDFRFSSFTKARFIGCYLRASTRPEIERTDDFNSIWSPFERGSLDQAFFGPSESRRTELRMIFMRSIGLRNTKFQDVDFQDCIFFGTSFDDCTMVNCKFDRLDLTRSACTMLTFKGTRIDQFFVTAEKLPLIIGAEEILPNSRFHVFLNADYSEEINQIGESLTDFYLSCASHFRQINSLTQLVNSLISALRLKNQACSINERKDIPSDDILTQRAFERSLITREPLQLAIVVAALDEGVRFALEGQAHPRVDDVADLILLLQVYSALDKGTVGKLDHLARVAFRHDHLADEVARAKLWYRVNVIRQTLASDRVFVEIKNIRANFANPADIHKLNSFVMEALILSGLDAQMVVGFYGGSVSQTLEIVRSFRAVQLVTIFLLVGGEVNLDVDGQEFRYKFPIDSFAKSIVQIIDAVMERVPDILGTTNAETLSERRVMLEGIHRKLGTASEAFKMYSQNEPIACAFKFGYEGSYSITGISHETYYLASPVSQVS